MESKGGCFPEMLLLPKRCLFCHGNIQPEIGWRAIFSEEKEQLLCVDCQGKLQKIGGERCRICSRELQLLDSNYRQEDLCHDCIRWEKDHEWKEVLDSNYSFFHYDDFFKELLAQYKFRGDYLLAKIFTASIQEYLQQNTPDFIVPVPLSDERLYERGFNQAEALINEAGYKVDTILSRIHAEKQSKKSRTERIHLPQVFRLNSNVEVMGKKVLIIDDIYTTGSTLRHAAKILKSEGAKTIQSLTLAR